MMQNTSISVQLRKAITAWEKRTRIPGNHVTLTVARRHLGRARGYAIRLLAGQEILTEWRRGTEEEAGGCYLAVMQSLSAMSGFQGITETSSDGEMITGTMLDTEDCAKD